MDVYGPLVFLGWMTLCVAGFHGGLLHGVRFLRQQGLIETRAVQFVLDCLFGRLGTNYALFYRSYRRVHGRSWALFALALHFACLLGFIVVPFLAEGFLF